MQHGGLRIVDTHEVRDRRKAAFAGQAVCLTGLDTTIPNHIVNASMGFVKLPRAS
jgi:hypothetical protein